MAILFDFQRYSPECRQLGAALALHRCPAARLAGGRIVGTLGDIENFGKVWEDLGFFADPACGGLYSHNHEREKAQAYNGYSVFTQPWKGKSPSGAQEYSPGWSGL